MPSWGLGSLVLACLVVGCGSAPEPAAPVASGPEEPVEDEPVEDEPAEAPPIFELAFRLPSTAAVGDELSLGLDYQLPDACWTSETVLSEPHPHQLLLTITHARREGMCAQVLSPQSTTVSTVADAPGEWSVAVVIDGQERMKRSFPVGPAEE